MSFSFRMIAAGALAAMIFFPAVNTAQAQDNSFKQGDASINIESEHMVIDDENIEKAVSKAMSRESGWYPKLHIGGTVSVNYNKNVDGVTDGTAFTFGLYIKGAIDCVYKNFEWQNKLEVEHQQTKVPDLEHFVKSADKFDLQTLFTFRIPDAEWVGPFFRFRIQTSLFPGHYLSEDATTVRYYKSGTKIDEKTDEKFARDPKPLEAQKTVKLANAFEPLILTESLGFFFTPFEHQMLNVKIKVGAAGQHLVANGGYSSFDDDDDDPFYDVRELVDTNSVGVEGELELSGIFVDYVNWSVTGSIYYPCATNDDHGLDGADLIHADIGVKFSFKMCSWASFDYNLIVKRAPFVTTDWQVTNTLLLTLGFDVFE